MHLTELPGPAQKLSNKMTGKKDPLRKIHYKATCQINCCVRQCGQKGIVSFSVPLTLTITEERLT